MKPFDTSIVYFLYSFPSDGKLLFGQVQLLEIDGLKLVQTNSIVRYIGDKAGFIPGNLDKRTR